MMKLLALDPSLVATGWASTQDSWLNRQVGIIEPKTKGVVRLQAILNEVIKVADGADLVVIEGYAFARPNLGHQLGELGGVIRLGLYQAHRPFVEVPPSCLKKVATGKGNAPKERVLAEAIRRLEYGGFDHNKADAQWLLAMAAIRYALPGAPQLPKEHLEGMRHVQWPDLPTVNAAAGTALSAGTTERRTA